MKKVDYIVVGLGIAGISFCEQLLKHNKSFVVLDNGVKGATANSGGILNPTMLKWLNVVWKASEFYPSAISFYENLAHRLQNNFFSYQSIYRIFSDVKEQNNWAIATDKKRTQQFLLSNLLENHNNYIKAPLGYGEVIGSMQIDVPTLLSDFASLLKEDDKLRFEQFQYDVLEVNNNHVVYKDITAKTIVFCDGIQALSNPLFPKEKLIGNKGEYLIIKAPDLQLDVLLKGPMYVIPLGNATYKVGATFNKNNLSVGNTQSGQNEIIGHLKNMVSCEFEIVGGTSGIRPTPIDQRPLVGSLREHPSVSFLNGLGSRGFLMAPLLGEILYKHLEEGIPISSDMDVNRNS